MLEELITAPGLFDSWKEKEKKKQTLKEKTLKDQSVELIKQRLSRRLECSI